MRYSYPQMLIVHKMMMITCSLVLVTIVLPTGMTLTNLIGEPITRAQNYLSNENGSNGLNSQVLNLTMNTAEVTIAKGAANLGSKAFSPDSTNINIGQNVTWTNGDSQFHTVTSGTGPDDPNVANEFDSKALSPGEKFSHVFNNESLVGTDLAYFCQIHPAMAGTITIGER
jgi:plastocyanin